MANSFAPGSTIHVRKLRPDGGEKLAWDGVVLHADRSGVVVRAEFTLPLIDLGCTTFRRGDVFVEFYYWRRPYTIAQVSTADGTLKGWYCDVCLPPRQGTPGDLSYVDLDLDLWCGADGAIVLLDEQEFAERRAAGGFAPEQVAVAERGWRQSQALAEQRRLPRWP
jgi:protein associated with RNAse G/E